MEDIKCIAFDCFGTVFDMDRVSRNEIADYVRHVNANDFSPYQFPASWYCLELHPDAKRGIELLRLAGYQCVTLSNGSSDLLSTVSKMGGVDWDRIIDLAKHRVYKPDVDAYKTLEIETGCKPQQTLMVTANPTFGDLEGAAAIGMPSQVIRHGYPNTIVELAKMLTKVGVLCGRRAAGLTPPPRQRNRQTPYDHLPSRRTFLPE